MKRIAYTRPDGGVSVVIPANGQNIDYILAKDIPADATNITVIDAVPTDRAFRDAWTFDGRSFGHDMVKAREIHRDRLRVQRAPLLVALDVAYARADEAGDVAAKAEIAARKQSLRDVTATPAIDAAQTVDDLKAIKLP
jgi:hypothetical protein